MENLDPERMSRTQLISRVDALEAQVEAMRAANQPAMVLRIQNAFGLTENECNLVMLLADGKPRRKEQIHAGIYSDRLDDPPEIKIVDVYVCKVRRKLDPYGVVIETVWGTGYFLRDRQGILQRVLAGGPLPSTRDIMPALAHPAHMQKRRHRQDYQAVLAELIRLSDPRGKVEFASRELAAKLEIRRTVSSLLDWMVQRGAIDILHRPKPGGHNGKKWAVRIKPQARQAIAA